MGWTVGASGFDCQQMHEIVFKMSAQILGVELACYFIVRSAGVRQLEHEAELHAELKAWNCTSTQKHSSVYLY